jgi:hypothetical protein
MSFNSRVLWSLVLIIVILFGVWYVATQHLSFASPAPAAVSTTTEHTMIPAPAPTTPAPAAPDLQTATANVVGSWQSTDDAQYTVAITASGKWTDAYGSDASATQTGTYTLFTSDKPDKDFTGILQPGVVYVKVVEGNSTLFFSVLEATGTNLQLSYLDRGNTLSFVRVQ